MKQTSQQNKAKQKNITPHGWIYQPEEFRHCPSQGLIIDIQFRGSFSLFSRLNGTLFLKTYNLLSKIGTVTNSKQGERKSKTIALKFSQGFFNCENLVHLSC